MIFIVKNKQFCLDPMLSLCNIMDNNIIQNPLSLWVTNDCIFTFKEQISWEMLQITLWKLTKSFLQFISVSTYSKLIILCFTNE